MSTQRVQVASIDDVFVDGKWRSSSGTAAVDVINPYTEEIVGHAITASEEDVDSAVKAAHHALYEGPWSRSTLDDRIAVVHRVGELINSRRVELAELATETMGIPTARWKSLGSAVELIDMFIEYARQIKFEYLRMDEWGNTLIRRRPVGVVAIIVPWNAPVRSEIKKIVPALLAGCTVVLKPAPETPFHAGILAEMFTEAGAPPGVVNVVTGDATTGEAMVTHPLVRKIAFTGSSATGSRIATLAAPRFKRLQLEMGGKSAALVLDDADVEQALPWLDRGIFGASGQVCVATSRIVAARSIYDDVVAGMIERAKRYVLGDPAEDSTSMGPLVAERQLTRVRGYIEAGVAEGAELVLGGDDPGQPHGWFVTPTVFASVDNSMKIAQEEIFGPVVSIIPFDNEADGIRIANDSAYGLGGAVYSRDPHHALQVAERVDSGYVTINQYGIGGSGPFGGVKNSGLNREDGIEGFDTFLEYVPHPVSKEFGLELAKITPRG